MISIDEAAKRLNDAFIYLRIDEKTEILKTLQKQISLQNFWDDAENAQKISKQASDIQDLIKRFNKAKKILEDAKIAFDFSQSDKDFKVEYKKNISILQDMLNGFEIESWFDGKYDQANAIMSINPGQGGLEAQDWTEMLYKMYCHYADNKGWKVKTLDIVPGEGIGLDRVSFQVDGNYAYGMLRSEHGVHRLVRISPTDEKKRRHTTFAGVEVVPVLPDDDITIDIDPNDIRVDVYRSSGPGGQSVNTTDSAVRLTHLPTGIVVTCQNEKSQLQNKEVAFRVLRGKLYEIEEQKRMQELNDLKGKKKENSFGNQIRNYILYPYQLIKDTRSNIESSNVEAALNGYIDEFVIGYHRWRSSQKEI